MLLLPYLNQGWAGVLLGRLNGLAHAIQVGVAILDVLHVPAQGLVPGGHILCERNVCVAVDGNLVVIVKSNELAQLPVPSQGRCLIRDALHVAAITHDDVPVAKRRVKPCSSTHLPPVQDDIVL
jgi:hypothetical protein